MFSKRSVAAALSSAVVGASMALAAPAQAAPTPATCGSVYDFFFTSCPLTWYGVTFYGTVDMGVAYETHGAPFDPNHATGELYALGGTTYGATNRLTGFFEAPNAMSQSVAGFRVKEPIGGGWSFVAQGEFAFTPYSFLLSNVPQSLHNAIGVAENQQAEPFDSSRWGWLAGQTYTGVSNPIWGTLTFGRQNALMNDAVLVYDPMGGAYAFSVIGFSGTMAGAGDTEDARWTTAIKYRVNVGDFRLAVMGQPIGGPDGGYNAYNPNNGAVAGQIGVDIKHFFPGVLSLDVFGTWEKDAVGINASYIGQTIVNGWPTTFPSGIADSGLKATISNQTSLAVMAKYSFGSWGDPTMIVGKAPPAPSGIPLTFYAGYEWIQFAEPSDQQTNYFYDDGFRFNWVNTAGTVLSANGTTINNNGFNASCGSGGGCEDKILQVMWAGAKYGITRDLDIIGAYYHYIQNSFVISPFTTSGVTTTCTANAPDNPRCAGWYDAYSAVIDWRFLPKWDWYIGTMYTAAYGGLAYGDITRNNVSTVTGVRFRF